MFLTVFLASVFGGLIALGSYNLFFQPKVNQPDPISNESVRFAKLLADTNSYTVPEGLNFVFAAETTTPSVVHIKSSYSANRSNQGSGSPMDEWLRDFFGDDPRRYQNPGQATGSGVIISADGYIVTNNHVIENADEIEVTLNDNRTYSAELVGTDPNTDLAVVKIEEQNLSFVRYGDSDKVRIGEWVLAVGNPFNLTSTVTAGIVSAKARNISILRRTYGIESFIQTDAAVNPGNSGGALVNLRGELIGINTAIATPTGTYAGYSFAVPVSLVKKVVNDLIEFGVVQRALLGISILDLNDPRIEDRDFDELKGVYVQAVNPGSAADEAGIEEGDIIVGIQEKNVGNVAELQEYVARNRPGDKIKVTYHRQGSQKVTYATLKNMNKNTEIVRRASLIEIEGATFGNLTKEEREELELEGGAKITELKSGKWQSHGIKEGFIVTAIDKRPIKDTEQLAAALNNAKDGILVSGMYPDGEKVYYGIPW